MFQIGKLMIEQKPFGEVTKAGVGIYAIATNFDGVFGLGFGERTPLDRLKEQGMISERVFCFE